MSDETIGIPGRAEWDRMCAQDDYRRIMSAIEDINTELSQIEDGLDDDMQMYAHKKKAEGLALLQKSVSTIEGLL